MNESNYTIGLIIASCLLLVVAIVLTCLQIAGYREVTLPRQPVAPTTPAPVVGGEAKVEAERAVETPEERAEPAKEVPAEEAAEETEGAGVELPPEK